MLREWFSKAERVVVAGVGNPQRMDDSIGMKIVQDLHGKVSEKVFLVECETVPESFIQEIIDFDPTHILVIDAAILGVNPGDARLIEHTLLPTYSAFSTHSLPLRLFCDNLTEATRAKVALLLVQPKKTDFGEELTPEALTSARRIVQALLRVLP